MDTRIDVLFKVERQHITPVSDVIITSGSRNYYHAVFEFDVVWLDLSPKAVFTVGNKSYIMSLNNNNNRKYECVIPWEVIDRDTGFYVGTFGGDSLRSDLTFVSVSKGAQVDGELPQPPTPDWYDSIERLTDEAVNTATEVQQRADNGEFDGKPGKDGSNGYTPQKGIDYFTESEVAEIVNKAAEAAAAAPTESIILHSQTSDSTNTPTITADDNNLLLDGKALAYQRDLASHTNNSQKHITSNLEILTDVLLNGTEVETLPEGTTPLEIAVRKKIDAGGIGGGSTGGGRLDINATMTDSSTCTLDKTFEEIISAYNGGMVVNVMMNGIILMPSAIQEGGINFIAFVDTDKTLTAITVYVTPDNIAKYFMRAISH